MNEASLVDLKTVPGAPPRARRRGTRGSDTGAPGAHARMTAVRTDRSVGYNRNI